MSRRRWLSSPAKARISSRDRHFGWMAGCSRARVGLIRRSHDFFRRIVRMVQFLTLGMLFRRAPRQHRAPVVELHAAKAAVVKLAARQAFQQVEDAGRHRIDRIAVLQLFQAGGSATRTAADGAKMVPEAARDASLFMTVPALIDCQVAETLPKRT